MLNWRKVGAVLAVFSLLLLPLSVSASQWDLPMNPVPPEVDTFTGVVEWVDLEGGFYAIEGYRLIVDEDQLNDYLGNLVQVRGSLSQEPSIYMVPAIKVAEIRSIEPGEIVSFSGKLVYEDLEGGFYAVKGYRLTGDVDEVVLKKYLGRQVQVTGSISEEVSIFMTKAFTVRSLRPLVPPVEEVNWETDLLPVEARGSLPRRLLVDGVEVQAAPMLRDETVMVPLRLIVEAAGGQVYWLSASQTARVVLSDRTALFPIGADEAELNEEGVYYVRRNLIPLAQPTQLIAGTTYVSADALTSILGFMAREAEPDVLDLVTPRKQKSKAPSLETQTLVGQVVEIEAGQQARILLESGPMANGEPQLVWLQINEDTEIVGTNGDLAQLADLPVGQQISVQLSGPMLLSFPAQAAAQVITILPKSSFTVVTGSIKDMATEGKTRILVEGTVKETNHSLLIWLTLDENTEISWSAGTDATVAHLAIGQTVEVELTSPVLESYPCQGGAAKVTIVK